MTLPSISFLQACTVCDVIKPHTLDFFHAASRGGLRKCCKKCHYLEHKARRQGKLIVGKRRDRDGLRRCKVCYVLQPLESFRFADIVANRRMYKCKPCMAVPIPEWKNQWIVYVAKRCTKCNEVQSFSAFPRNWTKRDGLEPRCKACARRAVKAWRTNDPENAKRVSARTYQRNREKVAERGRRYREENQTAIAARRAHYKKQNREILNEKQRQYSKVNRDYYNNVGRQRRALERDAEGVHTLDEIQSMLKDQEFKCAYCEVSIQEEYSVDHMLPLVRGGSNDWPNLAVCCPRCNSRKGIKTAEEYWSYLVLVGG